MPKDILPDLRLADVAELTLAANVQPVSGGMVISDPDNVGGSRSTIAGITEGNGTSIPTNETANCVNYVQNTSPQIEMANEGYSGASSDMAFAEMNCHAPDEASSYFNPASSANTQQTSAFMFNSNDDLYQPQASGGQQEYNHGDIGMDIAEVRQKSNEQDHIRQDYDAVYPYNIDSTSLQNSQLVNQTSPLSENQQNFFQEVAMADPQQHGVQAANSQAENQLFQKISEQFQSNPSEVLHHSNSNTQELNMKTQQMSNGTNSQTQMYVSQQQETIANSQSTSNINSLQVIPQHPLTFSPKPQSENSENNPTAMDAYSVKQNLQISSQDLSICSHHIELGTHQSMPTYSQADMVAHTKEVFSFVQQPGESNIQPSVYPGSVQPSVFPCSAQQGMQNCNRGPNSQGEIKTQLTTFSLNQEQPGLNVQQGAYVLNQEQPGLNVQQGAYVLKQEQPGLNVQQGAYVLKQEQPGLNVQQGAYVASQAQQQATYTTAQLNTHQSTFAHNQQQMNSNIQTENNQQPIFVNIQKSTEMNTQQMVFGHVQLMNSPSSTETSSADQQAFFANAEKVETNVECTVIGNTQEQITENQQTNMNTQNTFVTNAPKQHEGNKQHTAFNDNHQLSTAYPQAQGTMPAQQTYFANSHNADINTQQTVYGNGQQQLKGNQQEIWSSTNQGVFNSPDQQYSSQTKTISQSQTEMNQTPSNSFKQQHQFTNSQQQLNGNQQEIWSSNNQGVFNNPDHQFSPQTTMISPSQTEISPNHDPSSSFNQQQHFTNSQQMNTDQQHQNFASSMKYEDTPEQKGLQVEVQPGHVDGDCTGQVKVTGEHYLNTSLINPNQSNNPSPMDTTSPGKEEINSQLQEGMQFANESVQKKINLQQSAVPQGYQHVEGVQGKEPSQCTVFSDSAGILTGFQTGQIYDKLPTSDQPKQTNPLQQDEAKYDFGSLHPDQQSFLNATIDHFFKNSTMDSSNNSESTQGCAAEHMAGKQDLSVNLKPNPMMSPSTDTFSPNSRPPVSAGCGFQQYSEQSSKVSFQQTDKDNPSDQHFQTSFGINEEGKSAFNFGNILNQTALNVDVSMNQTAVNVDVSPIQYIPRSVQGPNHEDAHSQHVSRSTSGQASPSALDSPHLTSAETSGQLSPSLVHPQTQAQVNQFSKALLPRLLRQYNSGTISESNSMHQDHSHHLSLAHDTSSQASLVALSEQLKIEPVAETGPINSLVNLQFDEDTMFNIPNEQESIGVSNSLTDTSSAPSISFASHKGITSLTSSFLTSSLDSSATETSPRSTSITSEPTNESVFARPAHDSPRYKKLTGRAKKMREASLTQQFPASSDGYQLQIVEQPEDQHRARYKTEGSRGSVKDRSQQGHPAVKLIGIQQPVNLQVFVGNDSGRVKPHGFYQACKVCGKNSTPCTEKDIEGTTVIELQIDPSNDMLARMDCVGILKLRNADVEQRMGLAKAKKKSLKARLVFRVSFKRPDGCYQTLQVASHPILCTQPIGCPEISKKSLSECPVEGELELFMIGKNFMKGTKVVFEEVGEKGDIVWQAEGDIDKDFFQNTHLICAVPAYHDSQITSPVTVQVVVRCNNKTSYPLPFTYTPKVKLERMEVESCLNKTLLNKVAPAALHLNEMIAQTTASSNGPFQLPADVVKSILMENKGMKMETNQDLKPCNNAVFSIQTQTPTSQAFNPGRSVLISPTWTVNTQPLLLTLTNPSAIQSGISFSNSHYTTPLGAASLVVPSTGISNSPSISNPPTSANMQVGDPLQQMGVSNTKQ